MYSIPVELYTVPSTEELHWEHCDSGALPGRSTPTNWTFLFPSQNSWGDRRGPSAAGITEAFSLKSSDKDNQNSYFLMLTAGVNAATSVIIMRAAVRYHIDIKKELRQILFFISNLFYISLGCMSTSIRTAKQLFPIFFCAVKKKEKRHLGFSHSYCLCAVWFW